MAVRDMRACEVKDNGSANNSTQRKDSANGGLLTAVGQNVRGEHHDLEDRRPERVREARTLVRENTC